jgi:hypothetical protein
MKTLISSLVAATAIAIKAKNKSMNHAAAALTESSCWEYPGYANGWWCEDWYGEQQDWCGYTDDGYFVCEQDGA